MSLCQNAQMNTLQRIRFLIWESREECVFFTHTQKKNGGAPPLSDMKEIIGIEN